jgi:hypothetical protein
MVSATAYNGNDSIGSWSNVGSLWVANPSSGNPDLGDPHYVIQRVQVDRTIGGLGGAGQLTEAVALTVTTRGITDSVIQVTVQGPGLDRTVNLSNRTGSSGSYTYSGSTTLPTPSFSNGRATVTITTVAGTGTNKMLAEMIARYAWFQKGGPLLYVRQSTTGYSAVHDGSVTLAAETRAKVLGFNTQIVIKPEFKDGSAASDDGGDFWTSIFGGANLAQQIAVGSGATQANTAWALIPDTQQGGNDDGNIDIGESLQPYPSEGSAGDWGTALQNVVGKVVVVPVVGLSFVESSHGHGDQRWWPIQGFAALRVDSVVNPGDNNAQIVGRFVRWLAPGEWQDAPPGGTPLFVETAVLTD